MRYIISAISIIITLLIVASCSMTQNGEENTSGEEYTIFGTVFQDSTVASSDLIVFIDNHSKLHQEDLPVLNGKFIFKSMTDDVDEVFLVNQKGKATKIYAAGGAEIEVNIDSLGVPSFVGKDSLNIALHEVYDKVDALCEVTFRSYKDSVRVYLNKVGERYSGTVIPALVVREKMAEINDSVFLRQFLGQLPETSKPNWLVNSIEHQFDEKGTHLKPNMRLSPLPKFRTERDTVFFDMKETRQNSAYMYFWAEYDSTSIDSLKMLEPLAKYHGLHQYAETFKSDDANRRPKRIDLVTVCLNAKDSASWLKTIHGLPGYHIYLKDGLANPVMASWSINKIPYNLIIDRFSNIQDSYRWGKELRDVLEKAPTNFSIQVIHGSNSKNRRTSRN